ncbi:hypothetical protein NQD34_013349 [Periophthalmus magnuspinnatus]|nr:hypothetical protein NQD34_013349 [Periophthalmus magnuspinnatus]
MTTVMTPLLRPSTSLNPGLSPRSSPNPGSISGLSSPALLAEMKSRPLSLKPVPQTTGLTQISLDEEVTEDLPPIRSLPSSDISQSQHSSVRTATGLNQD